VATIAALRDVCAAQVLGSLLFSCIMVGKKMLVVAVIIRLRTRREELASVLHHLGAAVAPRELTPMPLIPPNAVAPSFALQVN
jgi:hypothetical protein